MHVQLDTLSRPGMSGDSELTGTVHKTTCVLCGIGLNKASGTTALCRIGYARSCADPTALVETDNQHRTRGSVMTDAVVLGSVRTPFARYGFVVAFPAR
jgi:hypothetical protein